MRLPLILALVAVPLLAAPTVVQAIEDEPLRIDVQSPRAGEHARYESWSTQHAENGSEVVRSTWLLHVEGPARAVDAYGVERDTVATVVETEGDAPYSARCHRLAGGRETVRTDVLASPGHAHAVATPSSVLGLPAGGVAYSFSANVTTVFGDGAPCDLGRVADGLVLVEGSPARFGAVFPGMDEAAGDWLSRPAVEVDHAGLRGLLLVFEIAGLPPALRDEVPPGADGRVEALLVEGVPRLARMEARMSFDADGRRVVDASGLALLGHEAGRGAPTPAGDARLPERHPDAAPAPADPLRVDDEAYGLSYPYREAWRAMHEDPDLGLREWLALHPRAILAAAGYDADQGTGVHGRLAGWSLVFADPDGSALFVTTTREHVGGGLLTGALDAVPAGVRPDTRSFASEGEYGPAPARAAYDRVVPSDALLGVARQHGLRGEVHRLAWSAAPEGGSPAVAVALGSSLTDGDGVEHGRHVHLDAARGAALSLVTTRESEQRTGVLAGAPAPAALATSAPARALLSAPRTLGEGIAATSVLTGAALLALAVKLAAAPLYTRLVRDRLLDNAVRARLYERVRAEPGIRQAELVDFAGIGEGAARRHLRRLASHGFLVEVRDGASVGYYAAGEVPPAVARQAVALRADTMRRVHALYSAEPSLPLREAGRRLGMSAPGVHRAKRKLERAGLLPAAPEAVVGSG